MCAQLRKELNRDISCESQQSRVLTSCGNYSIQRADLIVLGARLIGRNDVEARPGRQSNQKEIFSNPSDMSEVYLAAQTLTEPDKENPNY